MLLGMHIGDEEKAEMVARYAERAAAAGRDPGSVRHVSAVLGYVADDRAQAVRELREAMPGWLAAGLAAHIPIDGRPRLIRDSVAYAELCARCTRSAVRTSAWTGCAPTRGSNEANRSSSGRARVRIAPTRGSNM
ncbi:LLM class flavin-dependent oxidoreductase [Saccharopolyspora sp. K220]|uniref:LLM class flavin-dependent oxidoreductase n=1 Tax=Saccharopolyspora soli TaxID=2926618 RepID=UPI001F58431D|nr:LLM class flavin-dependent oxidoreductase [Saccharopolyspora soli]MCI2423858.1 LLM class flavin-dependent oxidoreductase [Saccharopolyspora soli]